MSEKQKEEFIKPKITSAHDYRAYFRQALDASKRQPFTDFQIAAFVTVIAGIVRLYKIWEPTSVVFDEVHFGKFAGKYINHTYFFDVHPPLAKLLIAGVGSVAGYDGLFDFNNIGDDYLAPAVPYVSMRLFCGILGLLTIPMSYITVKASGHSTAAALVAATLVCFENGFVANNRLILLDSPLLFFISFTIMAWMKFSDPRLQPFSFQWKIWLFLTGLGLGCSISSKWVGLFTIATVGCSTIKGLWDIWGDLSVSPSGFGRHFINRVLYLIIVPILIYIFAFGVHFTALPLSGDGDTHMSPAFQQTLKGNEAPATRADVAYNSIISIRHLKTNGGYLHSHSSRYETGSEQQQITLYSFRDDNNLWKIRKGGEDQVENADELEWVKNGDIIRLEHVSTSPIMLHSHDHRPPVTEEEYHNEVSGYGFKDYEGDANDYWRVEIVDHSSSSPAAGERLQALRSVFRLIHINEGCTLFSHSVKLPKWAFDQQEVTCIKGGTMPKTQWYIEQNDHPLLNETAELVSYENPGFFKKFLELNKVMWTSNAGLVDSHPYDSRPPSWPILQRGISMWSQDEKQIYLLGNPLIYWGSTWAIFSYLIVRGVLILRQQRGYSDKIGIAGRYFQDSIGFYVAGWTFHFLPFLLMGRQLFLHHYMPALYFGILGFAAVFDLLTKNLRSTKKILATTVLIAVIVGVFMVYAPITYGTTWTRDDCLRSKVMDKWDYSCDTYLDRNPLKPIITEAPSIHLQEESAHLEVVSANDKDMNVETKSESPMQPTPSAPMDEHSGEFGDEEDGDDEWYRLNRPGDPEEEEEEEDEDDEEDDEDDEEE
ncbi:hypothetical protein K450DRAFT_182243 [Umbelopsis ramanniana AG]|uniref:Dolichyl-phosphate-mannose--protein mannosyltransferase n=1 Tax=Umbelopsis ramanniana AG TaxID=1314678 RepID=A0AAD5EI08_UMBRA|nr:uncharacterized protein K450DRAFT_182243 [Umbelopsis ramanniana AG]KAI8584241.1 hypothetical protein K450DRAFT_182243 [Umbelopsis ramanniana AG]